MPQIGPLELVIILVIVIIFFGVGRLGEVGGAMGKGIREFRKAASGENEGKETEEAKAATKAEASAGDTEKK